MQRSVSPQADAQADERLAPSLWAPSPQLVRRLRTAAVPFAGLFVGMGLAGAVLDGLIVQQALGWHPLTADPEAAGAAASLYFVATLTTLLLGLDVLFRLSPEQRRRSRRELVGWALLGAGLFMLLVGLGDHHLAAVRHVRPDAANVLLWDLAYLGVGLALAVAGAALLRRRGAQLSRPARSTARSSGFSR